MELVYGKDEKRKDLGNIGHTGKPLAELLTETIFAERKRRSAAGEGDHVAMIRFDHADELMLQHISHTLFSDRDRDRDIFLARLLNDRSKCAVSVLPQMRTKHFLVTDARTEVARRRANEPYTAFVCFAEEVLGGGLKLHLFF